MVQARAARLSDTVALFQALGGGWWNREEPPVEKALDVNTGATAPLTDRHDGFWWWWPPAAAPQTVTPVAAQPQQ